MPKPRFVQASELVDDSPMPPFTVSISGHEGTGKTSLALTIAEVMPVFMIETEFRVQYLLSKLHFSPDHEIRVAQLATWNEIEGILNQLSSWRKQNDEGPAALIIDSATDYKNFADHVWRETSPTFPVTNYSKLYKMMDDPIIKAKASGMSVIMTTRMKPFYRNNEWDGESYRPDMFKNQMYITDAGLEFNTKGDLRCTKNSWEDIRTWETHPIDRSQTLPEIIESLMKGEYTNV